jgi:ParB family transcriptional regulator, chromosome partitioning protein
LGTGDNLMARRNIFQPPPPPAAASTDMAEAGKPRFPNTGAMSGVKSTLKDLSSNAIRELDAALIEDDGPSDRLAFTDADVAQLAESIRAHGQQVPIMVRPVPGQANHYRIVYGRRRLHALRLLGIPAKALVRSLTDEQAILAQGQENAQRLDPSFIEKALFTAELVEAGYDAAIILDALAIDKPMLSRMAKVARSLPEAVIQTIGSAHGIGRRRWEALADAARDNQIDLVSMMQGLALEGLSSDQRFALISDAASNQKPVERPPALPITAEDGTQLAEVSETARAVTLKVSKTSAPAFARWLHDNAEAELTRLYQAWQSTITD